MSSFNSDTPPREFTLYYPPRQVNMSDDQSNPLDSSVIRQSLHQIQLKDAILRQQIRKAQRTRSQIAQKIQSAKTQIEKLNKQLQKDDKLLIQQQKAMSSAETAPIFSKISVQSFSHLQGIIQKKRTWIFQAKERIQQELEYFRQVRFITNNLNSTNPENTLKLKELMIQLTGIYQEHIQAKQTSMRVDQAVTNQDLAALNRQKQKLERILDGIRELRIKDQRLIFQLESKIKSLQGENTLTNQGHDDKTEENAIAAAEQIVGKLKQKLHKIQDLSPFVSKLEQNVNKSKKRIIHLDLSN